MHDHGHQNPLTINGFDDDKMAKANNGHASSSILNLDDEADEKDEEVSWFLKD